MNDGTHAAYRETGFFASLDGLRCLSILAVIWHHTGTRSEALLLSQQGYLGVHLFFAISGFLITTLLLRER
jgi:peptidoglycan/LPS O-acetylase OafA/YrhL